MFCGSYTITNKFLEHIGKQSKVIIKKNHFCRQRTLLWINPILNNPILISAKLVLNPLLIEQSMVWCVTYTLFVTGILMFKKKLVFKVKVT